MIIKIILTTIGSNAGPLLRLTALPYGTVFETGIAKDLLLYPGRDYTVPNGTEFNYRNYVNGPVPCYWADFNKYDLSDFQINGLIENISNLINSGQAAADEYDPIAYDEENQDNEWGE